MTFIKLCVNPVTISTQHTLYSKPCDIMRHNVTRRISVIQFTGCSDMLQGCLTIGFCRESHISYSLISISTPEGRSNLIKASMVLGPGSRISIKRLCVRISKCSNDSLSTKVERCIGRMFFSVGSRTGPEIRAPVRLTVSTIFAADWSKTRWSNARRRIRTLSRRMVNGAPRTSRGEG